MSSLQLRLAPPVKSNWNCEFNDMCKFVVEKTRGRTGRRSLEGGEGVGWRGEGEAVEAPVHLYLIIYWDE